MIGVAAEAGRECMLFRVDLRLVGVACREAGPAEFSAAAMKRIRYKDDRSDYSVGLVRRKDGIRP